MSWKANSHMLFYLLSLGGAGVPCWTADSFIEQTDITLFWCETGQAEQTRYAYLEVYTWLIVITFCVFNICCIYCCIKAVSHSRLQYTIYHSDMSAVEFLHDIYCWKMSCVLMRSVWSDLTLLLWWRWFMEMALMLTYSDNIFYSTSVLEKWNLTHRTRSLDIVLHTEVQILI